MSFAAAALATTVLAAAPTVEQLLARYDEVMGSASYQGVFAMTARRGLRPSLTSTRRRVMRDRLAHLGLGLEDRLHDRAGQLSAGQRQSLTLVMAVLRTPRLLLLDEHLAALDPATAARVLTLTTDLVSETGCTTLMITHHMGHALRMGTRLLLMSRGRIVTDLPEERKNTMTTQNLADLLAR